MSGFSIWPRVVKGAFVVYFAKDDSGKEDPSQTPTVIPFQYNPETIRRTVTLKGPDDKNGKGALVAGRRVQGFPDETINMTIDLDATDAIATLDPVATAVGLAPMLAMLELMTHPPRSWQPDLTAKADAGKVAVKPASAPLTLLVWGPMRVAPVLLTSLSITEEAFDPALNPTLAKVDVTMRVLTTLDLADSKIGTNVYGAYSDTKWNMAEKLGLASWAASALGSRLAGGG